jgi:cytochrome c oxidase cbb3-type subunit 2
MRVLQKLGHPYTEDEIAAAPQQLEGLREMDALIVYLQMLGSFHDPAAAAANGGH